MTNIMNQQGQIKDIAAFNENSLQELTWAIESSRGEFSLILALCNSASLRQRLTQELQVSSPVEIREIILEQSVTTLYTTIQAELGNEHPEAIIVSGLESVKAIDSMLTGANQVREEFRKNFPFPVLFWVTDEVLQKLIRLAPDFQSWTTTVEFAIPTEDLIQYIQQTADEVFAKVLEVGAGRFLDNTALNLGIGSPRRTELELARVELQNRDVTLHPEIEASLEFVLGRDAHGSMEQSRQHYERSLALLPNTESPLPKLLERRACLLYCMGLWWRTYAVLNHVESDRSRATAKDYFQECITVFDEAKREDLVANFINGLGAVLQRMQCWDELEAVARRAISLHQTYPHQFRLARAYGFLAEVALAKSAWKEAQESAQQALAILDNAASTAENSVSSETIADLEWEQSSHRGWYLFALARAQIALGEKKEAIATLETAKVQTKAQYDPELYIHILSELRNCYFGQAEYLKAFNIKLELRSNEQTYGIRAFTGAGRLQPKQQVTNPALVLVEQQETVAQEIAATGREQDIKRLVERVARPDHKLTIIYGQSGVGKSSILQAGLIPVLKNKAIGTRDVVPVLQQVYPDWIRELGDRLAEALLQRRTSAQNSSPQDKQVVDIESILNQLQRNIDDEVLTVLIFDQFEEFFFVYKDPKQRLIFYNFLRECLDVAHVRVILSLREDYLYYLLECNDRLANLEVISNNILDKDILYYLGNFSRKDAKALIESFTKTTKLLLESSLIDALVEDLAGDFGEIRPIELQVVGTQIQTEKITTLEQYRERGPKEELVGRFLEEVVKDCGTENEQIAKLVLYLLTDENNTRPLKNRADLELELEVKSETLDLVLLILVKSGLVFKVPAVPADRYQLVHDYLVPFVRQQQSERLIKELEKEREQRKLTEVKLTQVLRKQLRDARRATMTLAGLVGATGVFAILAAIVGINTYLTSSFLSLNNQELDQLVSAIKAGKQQKHLSSATITDTQLITLSYLNYIVNNIEEHNRLDGHTDKVRSISFSADSKIIATLSKDKTAKVWSINGKEITTLRHHNNAITSVSLSSNGKMIATAGQDHTVILWKLEGGKSKKFKVLNLQDDIALSLSFSPDGKILSLGNRKKNVKLWQIDSGEIKTLSYSDSVINMAFSPDGKNIAAAGKDGTVKIWRIDGKEIGTINNYGTISMNFSSDGKTLIVANQDRTVKFYNFEGTLLKTINSCCEAGGKVASMSITPDANKRAFVNSDLGENSSFVKLEFTGSDNQSELEHKDNVTYLSVSPDGKVLASASNKTVKLWSIKSQDVNVTEDDKNIVTKTKFSSDGKLVAAGSVDNTVKLWRHNYKGEFETSPYKTIPGDSSVLSFSPDGKTLVTGSADDIVKLWSIDGREISLREHVGHVASMSISPDGKTIAVANQNNTVQLWKHDGTLIQALTGYSDKLTKISFSPDSQIIATVGKNNIVKLWKNDGNVWRSNGTFIHSPVENTKNVVTVSFSPDSKIIASYSDNNLVRLWRKDGTLIKILKGHPDIISSVIFSPDSKIIASLSNGDYYGSNSEIRLWQSDGTLLKSINDYAIQKIFFSPDSRIIASIMNNNTIKLWSLNGTLLATLQGHRDKINHISFSPDSEIIATASSDSMVKLWRIRDGKELKTLRGHSEAVNEVSFSPDGKMIASASTDKTVRLWNIDGRKLKILHGHSNGVDSVSFSSDGKIMISESGSNAGRHGNRDNYTLKVWKSDGTEIKTLIGHSNRWGKWSSSKDIRIVAFVSKEDALKVWRTDGALLATLKGHSDWINSVSFSADGKMIASASDDKTVRLWNSDGKQINIFKGHKDKVNSVSFSPDSKMIASASDDKTVRLWNSDGREINLPKAHGDKVNSVSFSPDGKRIASASDDNKIQLWSRDGRDAQEVQGFISGFDSLSFSPDGNMLALSSMYSVQLYPLNSFWLKRSMSIYYGVSDYPLWNVSFSADGKAIAVPSKDGRLVLNSLDLDELLVRGCNWARDYLKNNPNVDKSDRTLCDDIK